MAVEHIGSLILGIIIIVSALITIIIVLSSRKIDFGDRAFNPRKTLRRQIVRELRDKRKEAIDIEKEVAAHDMMASLAPTALPTRPPTAPEAAYSGEEEAVKKSSRKRKKMDEEGILGGVRGEMIDEEMDEEGEAEEVEMLDDLFDATGTPEVEGKYNRDLAIRLPKNMCIDEVFRLKISIKKTEEYSSELKIKEMTLDKKEAQYYALTVEKLGRKISEATIKLTGINEEPLTIRPMAIGGVAQVAPSSRTIMFDPKVEETVIEFYLTPTRWTTGVMNVLRIEFEQNYEILKALDIPIRIYKRKYEAIFGLNISAAQKYILLIYSALGTVAGLYGTLANFVDFLPALPF